MADRKDEIYQYEPLWREWTIDEFLGAGSYGQVYRIVREKNGEIEVAAVKFISIPKDEKEEQEVRETYGIDTDKEYTNYLRERLNSYSDEISLMQKLSTSDHIVRYQASTTEQKQDQPGWNILIQMECLTPLNRRYFKEHSISRRDVAQIGMDICKALISCHEQNIIHRDVKLANIFVDKKGSYKLGDFGVSRIISGSASASRTGTLDYIAPEVEKYERYDHRADIYSLGIVLYKLLNNMRNPFLSSEGRSTWKQAEEANDKRLRGEEALEKPRYASGSSNSEKKLAEIVLRACAYNKTNRYQTAEEMLIDLQSIESNLSDEIIYGGTQDNSYSCMSVDKGIEKDLGSIKTIPGKVFDNPDDRMDSEFSDDEKSITTIGDNAGLVIENTLAEEPVKNRYDKGWNAFTGKKKVRIKSGITKQNRDNHKRNRCFLVIAIVAILIACMLLIITFLGINGKGINDEIIEDSWAEILASVEDGSYLEKYQIGDIKKIDLGSEGIVEMQIAAFDADELADGSGKAAITWISRQQLFSDRRMNPEPVKLSADSFEYQNGTGSIGGWEHSEMRKWMQENVKPLIPQEVRQSIKPVIKYSASRDSMGQWLNNVMSVDDVWIPSYREIFGTSDSIYESVFRETEGPDYTQLFESNEDRKKTKNNLSEAGWWWLRSVGGNDDYYENNDSYFRLVDSDGFDYYYNSLSSEAIVLGFCI